MENRIYDIKDKLLAKMEEEMQDMNRMDSKEVGELADAIHHLAEAEYYCSVADAMWAEKHGYGSSGGNAGGSGGGSVTQARRGYTEMPMRSGYAMASRGSMGHDNLIDQLAQEYDRMSPDEQMMMKSKVLMRLGGR